ncbi:unnamed protein product [Phaedon cochleariae]|uniref:Mitochondrial uncoupling protein 4 n=1 Tax=Phaedon cochleariae TaxID=80249 RepID=A0A9P0GJM4_PHACE|nr:unnamed protein product [Phaedon cochleariae]
MKTDDPPEPKKKGINVDTLWCMYLVSVASACNAELFTYPLDLIKTRLQVQGEKADKLKQAPHRGMLKTGLGIVREEGPLKLWQGIHAIFLRHLVYSGTRMVVYMHMRNWIVARYPNQEKLTVLQCSICGVAGGAIGQFIASPADLMKVQLQMEGKRRLLGLPPRVLGITDAFQKVWNANGVAGLWKGWVPNVQRAALVNLGDLTTYDLSKRFIQRKTGLADKLPLHVLASGCAGFAAAVLSTPADVIKTRVMNQPTDEKGRGTLYTSSTDCLRKTVRAEGVAALYKGFIPTWVRLAPWALTFWVTYEQIMTFIGAKNF